MTDHTAPAASDFSEVVRWISSLRVDVAETVNGVLLRGARSVQVGNGGTLEPATSPGALLGFGLRNPDPGAPAIVYLRDSFPGQGADGDIVVPIKLDSSYPQTTWFGPGGINLSRGLYIDVAEGQIEGAVYLRGSDA